MSYIIKNTSALVNTRVTDVGRRRISQGNFNISYFQIGDSEVNYKVIPTNTITNNNILEPSFNAQNNASRSSNKENVKYPYYVAGLTGNTYGIPYLNSRVDSVYNTATPKGFFSASTPSTYYVQITSGYTVNSNLYANMVDMLGQNTITLYSGFCSSTTGTPKENHFITFFMDGMNSCSAITNSAILTYKIQSVSQLGNTFNVTLDRNLPDYSDLSLSSEIAKVQIYPSGMTEIYDTITPQYYWQIDTLNFESPCDVINRENTLVWNMNIPWTENPAGLFSSTHKDYLSFSSITYNGTKELLGYQENSGQTDTDSVYYYNSFDEKILVSPQDQKTIAIIHYTNNDIDFVYGEKFATQPYDASNPVGSASNFKLSIPTVLWHKSINNKIGLELFIDPPGYPSYFTKEPYYIKSTKNLDMNDPGIRYYHLWDTNVDDNGNINRVGKVFPDHQIIVIDDEELVAAMSYKSNRNFTLPAPKLSLITPNTCFNNNQTSTGIMTTTAETMWVSYLFESNLVQGLHCNYYSKINGPDQNCSTTSQNVAIRFGNEFPFLVQGNLSGFTATVLRILCQKVNGDARPDPTQWREIDVTSEITLVNGYILPNALTGKTFEISVNNYQNAPIYNLSNFLEIPTVAQNGIMNFGEEFYFYGNLETDITATIYEMRYLVTLNTNQFTSTSNPTWTPGTTSFISEIGLYNDKKELMIVSKLQSPQQRQGVQQFVVKLDW